jgi:transcriptional regulator with XRE-family HTH domain
MTWDDLSSRFKNIESEGADASSHPIDPGEATMLRGRITGVLIRDARVAKGYTVEQLAELLQVDGDYVVAWEFGNASPSLPQLELLAYWLEVPVSHFISGTETMVQQVARRSINQIEYVTIRNRMIGAQIREARSTAGFTLAYLAEQTGLEPEMVQRYEYGQVDIPISHLNDLASILRVTPSFFLEGTDRVGKYLQAQELFETFLQMEPTVREFVANPANHSYIELAMKFADMDVDKLRTIAETILEITY